MCYLLTQTDTHIIYFVFNHLRYTVSKKNNLTEYLVDKGRSTEQNKCRVQPQEQKGWINLKSPEGRLVKVWMCSSDLLFKQDWLSFESCNSFLLLPLALSVFLCFFFLMCPLSLLLAFSLFKISNSTWTSYTMILKEILHSVYLKYCMRRREI